MRKKSGHIRSKCFHTRWEARWILSSEKLIGSGCGTVWHQLRELKMTWKEEEFGAVFFFLLLERHLEQVRCLWENFHPTGFRITDTFHFFYFYIHVRLFFHKRDRKPRGILSTTGTWKSIEKEDFLSLWSFIFIELRIYTLFESYCIVCVPAFIFGLLLSDPAGRICGSASFFSENLLKMFFNGFLLLLFSTNDDSAQCLATILNVKKKKEKRRKNFA